jgi:hypothetical protein
VSLSNPSPSGAVALPNARAREVAPDGADPTHACFHAGVHDAARRSATAIPSTRPITPVLPGIGSKGYGRTEAELGWARRARRRHPAHRRRRPRKIRGDRPTTAIPELKAIEFTEFAFQAVIEAIEAADRVQIKRMNPTGGPNLRYRIEIAAAFLSHVMIHARVSKPGVLILSLRMSLPSPPHGRGSIPCARENSSALISVGFVS